MSTSGGATNLSPPPLYATITNGDSTVSRVNVNDSSGSFPALIAGDMLVSCFQARASGARNTIRTQTGGTGPGATTLAKVAVFLQNSDLSLTLAGQSANFVTFPGTFQSMTHNLTAPIQVVAGQIYGIGELQVGAAPASVEGQTIVNLGGGDLPIFSFVVHGLADIPATVLPGAQVAINFAFYAALT